VVGRVDRLNAIAESLLLPDARAMLRVWLSSFDKPCSPSLRGVEEEVLGHSYTKGDDYSSGKRYWLRLSLDRIRACLGFSGALSDLVAIIISNGGTIVHAATLGLNASS